MPSVHQLGFGVVVRETVNILGELLAVIVAGLVDGHLNTVDLAADPPRESPSSRIEVGQLLSAELVSVRAATGSSPDKALFFDGSDYVGTATCYPYPFTNMNWAATSDDTIDLNYKDGRFVCACPGAINTRALSMARRPRRDARPPPPAPKAA